MAEEGCGAKGAAPVPAMAPVDTAGEEAVNADTALPTPSPWMVARGPRKTDWFDRLTMVGPAAFHLGAGCVGACAAAGGASMASLLGSVTGTKRIDSKAFQMGFASFLCSQGLFYEVKFEPLGEAGNALQQLVSPSVVLKENDMNITPVIVSNHISYLDGFVLAHAFKSPKLVVKAELREVPVLGPLLEEAETIFVDRSAAGSKNEARVAIQEHCNDWTFGSRPLLVFPEGTTTNGEGLIEFKNGAFVSGKPVRPVILVYTGQFDPAKPKYVQTGTGDDAQVEEYSDFEWLMQILGHVKHNVHVRVLPPYIPSEEEKSDPGKYAAGCKAYMEREQMRVKEELSQNSWKTWAGREEGGLDYKFGDVTKGIYKRMWRK